MSTTHNEIFDAIKINFWSVYDTSTTKLSNICRQLAFAQGGICWFYISQPCQLSSPKISSSIFFYLIWFFIVDALQYLASSIIYAGFALYFERKNDQKKLKSIRDVDRKYRMNIIPSILFIIKLLLISKSSYIIIQLLTK